MRFLTRQEELVLLTIYQLKGSSYLIRIREFLIEQTGREWSISSVYVPLSRLAREDLLREIIGKPTAKRGGKAIKYYELTEEGIEILKELNKINQIMWNTIQTEKNW